MKNAPPENERLCLWRMIAREEFRYCQERFWMQIAIASLLTLLRELLCSVAFYNPGCVDRADAVIAQIAKLT